MMAEGIASLVTPKELELYQPLNSISPQATLSLPKPGWFANRVRSGFIVFYKRDSARGLRLPLSWVIWEFIYLTGIAPGQLASNEWSSLIIIVLLWSKHFGRVVKLREIL